MYRLTAFLNFFLYAVNEHSLHSPFAYDTYTKVIKPSKKKEGIPEFESLRNQLRNNREYIKIKDFGTGNKSGNFVNRILNKAVSKKWKSILMLDLAEWMESKEIIELGTSLGINTLYLSKAVDSCITTFEGSPELVKIARKNFNDHNCQNIAVIEGNIDKTLPSFLEKKNRLDMVFFDANHAYKPTINYYKECSKLQKDTSVFIFDDIYYSREMTKAWNEICKKPEVTLSIDLFHLGIVFFDPSFKKKHLRLMS